MTLARHASNRSRTTAQESPLLGEWPPLPPPRADWDSKNQDPIPPTIPLPIQSTQPRDNQNHHNNQRDLPSVLRVVQWNANSLSQSRMSKLELELHLKNIHVCAACETKWNAVVRRIPNLKTYELMYKNHNFKTQSQAQKGVAILF